MSAQSSREEHDGGGVEEGSSRCERRFGVLPEPPEWLDIHATLMSKMKAAGLQYGGAIPSWVDDYYGEPVQAVFAGRRKPVIEHMMPLLRQYVIMSYNTNPDKLIDRIAGELTYAASLRGPRVIFD